MSLTHEERLRAVGCGLKGKLVRLLSLGVIYTTTSTATTATTTTINTTSVTISVSTTTAHHTRHVEPDRNRIACHKLMQSTVRRVAAGLAAVVRDKVAQEAAELFLEKGQYSAARVQLQRAIHLGDLPSRALGAWKAIGGCYLTDECYLCELSEDNKEQQEGLALAEEGARLGCHHCQGVMAVCYCWGVGCKVDAERSLELALESSRKGSRYGHFTLGKLHQDGEGGLEQDYAQAAAFYRLAAAQGLDAAQCILGQMYQNGQGVARSYTKALRWFKLAAAQGPPPPEALCNVACCYEDACIHWYKRARAAGDCNAEEALQRWRRLGDGSWGR
jgi:TPR repeat protein